MGSNWLAYRANAVALYTNGGYNTSLAAAGDATGGGVNYSYYSGMNTTLIIGAHD